MSLAKLILFCCLLGVGSACSKIVEKELTRIGDTLELIAKHMLDIEVPGPSATTQPPSNACSSGSGEWSLIARVDMTDPSQQCPSGFTERNDGSSLRLCGRSINDPIQGCISALFNVPELYTQITGRIVGYQYGAPFGFYGHYDSSHGIEGAYVDGFSLTHGQSPREHIWTFAGGSDDSMIDNNWVCPCTSNLTLTPPSFVGEHYFCETANHVQMYTYSTPFYTHPLWDGEECGGKMDCCNFHNPPWFCKTLSTATSDPIELRQCNNYNQDSDTPFELVEIWAR